MLNGIKSPHLSPVRVYRKSHIAPTDQIILEKYTRSTNSLSPRKSNAFNNNEENKQLNEPNQLGKMLFSSRIFVKILYLLKIVHY